jgi:outer membrane receptor protein involved in Fe transport
MGTKLITLFAFLILGVKMVAQEALPLLPIRPIKSLYEPNLPTPSYTGEGFSAGFFVVVTAQRMEVSSEKLFGNTLLASFTPNRRTTPEALATTPGIFVQKTNHGGGSPFVRGLTGNQTLLLVDGIRLSNATFRYGPNQYLNTVDPYSIDEIAVFKGEGSVGYGSDALGGTINVLTNNAQFEKERGRNWGGQASSFWRSQGMEKTAHGGFFFSGKKLAINAGGTLRKFGDLMGGDTTGAQSPSGYDEVAFDLKGKVRLGGKSSLTLAHQFFRQDDVPVYHKIRLENFARNHITLQQRQLSYARFEYIPNWGSGLQKITATASLQRTDEERESQKNGSLTLRKESDQVRSLGTSVLAEFTVADWWRSTVGLETYHDLVGSTRSDLDTGTGTATAKRGLYPDGATHLSNAVFCTNQWESGDWNFTGGLRFNHFSIKVADENIGEAHLTPSALVWNAGALRKLDRFNSAFASFNTAFRAPNVDDLGSLGIVDFRYEVPTADLKPEKSYNMELGWRHNRETWGAETSVFRNELRDLITRVRVGTDSIAGYPVYQKENVQEGYIHGIETSIRTQFAKHFWLNGNLAWQYGQNVTDDEPLRRIPPLFGNVSLRYYKSQMRFRGKWTGQSIGGYLEWLFAAKQDRLAAGDKADNRIPKGGTPGWNVLNFYGFWTIPKGKFNVTLRAGLWNLFNADYRYHGSGVNGVGRSVTAGVTVGF